MKRTPTKKELSQLARRRAGSIPLSLSDLQVPVRPLLTRLEEWKAGARVRVTLRRMERLLPRHWFGYRRFLDRMDEINHGGGAMFSWMPLRGQIESDRSIAQAALTKAERLIRRSPKRVAAALSEGVAVLLTYPLDPETLFQWVKQVVRPRSMHGSAALPSPVAHVAYFQKVDRILRRCLDVLERERDRLVLPNLRLVLKEVFRYHPLGMRHSDLFQEGVLGLHKAVLRYDPGRGTRFSTYATYWIRQSIRKSLIDKARMIRVPQAVQEEMRKDHPAIDPNEAERVRKILSETMLFSAADSDDDDRGSFDVKDRHPSAVADSFHTEVIPNAVDDALSGLDLRSREVLRRRFGLHGDRPQTLEEIGLSMSLSRERIRQIEREALRRMQTSRELREVYEDLGALESAPLSRN
jgi:RNA polymerase sigma factor (sigma-70 family)